MNLQTWYNKAVKIGTHTYVGDNCEFLIYKGFKISKFPDRFSIQNVRTSDFYSNVSDEDMEVLKKEGFIKGSDTLSYERNKVRFTEYIKTLEKLYENRKEYLTKYDNNPKFYTKRLKNCEEGLCKYSDLLFFYKAKILQYEQIYNINNNLKFFKDE